MNWKIFRSAVLLSMVWLASLTGVVHAAQRCDTSTSGTTPTSRFNIDTQEGTAYDTKTKLTWKICPEGMTYAGGSCAGSPSCTRWDVAVRTYSNDGQGWRIPNIDEILSIVEKNCFHPTINLNVFPNTQSYNFWSASASTGDSETAWGVYFFDGRYGNHSKSGTECVRLVRGEQWIDPLGNFPLGKEKELPRRQAEEERRRIMAQRVQAEEDHRRAEEQRRQEQNFKNVLTGRNPRSMYLLAGEMEDRREWEKARDLYRRIVKDFPSDDLAIKASDSLKELRRRGWN